MNDTQLDALVAFMVAHPRATLADVMAEFDLSDTEAAAALRTLRAGLIKLRHAVLTTPQDDDLAAHLRETVDELRGE